MVKSRYGNTLYRDKPIRRERTIGLEAYKKAPRASQRLALVAPKSP